MGKTKGTTKTGGRRKGTPNKITKHLRGQYEDFINDKLPLLTQTWDDLDDSDKWNIIIKMSSFVIPKKIENEVSIDDIRKIKESQDKINEMFT